MKALYALACLGMASVMCGPNAQAEGNSDDESGHQQCIQRARMHYETCLTDAAREPPPASPDQGLDPFRQSPEQQRCRFSLQNTVSDCTSLTVNIQAVCTAEAERQYQACLGPFSSDQTSSFSSWSSCNVHGRNLSDRERHEQSRCEEERRQADERERQRHEAESRCNPVRQNSLSRCRQLQWKPWHSATANVPLPRPNLEVPSECAVGEPDYCNQDECAAREQYYCNLDADDRGCALVTRRCEYLRRMDTE